MDHGCRVRRGGSPPFCDRCLGGRPRPSPPAAVHPHGRRRTRRTYARGHGALRLLDHPDHVRAGGEGGRRPRRRRGRRRHRHVVGGSVPRRAGAPSSSSGVGDGPAVDLLPAGLQRPHRGPRVRRRRLVGAGAARVWFANWADQRLYRLDRARRCPCRSRPSPRSPRGDRWADGDLDPTGRWLRRRPRAPPAGRRPGRRGQRGRGARHDRRARAPRARVAGPTSCPTPGSRPTARRLCWLQWSHPDMPWDGTELCVADLRGHRRSARRCPPARWWPGAPTPVPAATATASRSTQARWAADGSLWFVSDRTGWWNLYRWVPPGAASGDGRSSRWSQMDAEIGVPPVGLRAVRATPSSTTGGSCFAYARDGLDHLAVRRRRRHGRPTSTCRTRRCRSLQAGGRPGRVRRRVGRPPSPRWCAVTARRRRASRRARGAAPAPRPGHRRRRGSRCPSRSTFPTSGGRTAHALFYPPTNPEATPPPGERPPLLVLIHGGPTAAARPMLQLGTQYWTSRGFAVVDVNYGGSTGYGRAYRNQLRGQWGVVDLDDCEAAARWLGRAGPGRPRPAVHPRRVGRRLHDAGRAGLPRHVRRRRQPLRRRRPRGAGHRDPQVREPLPRRARSARTPRPTRPVRRALADPPRRRLRPAADRVPGPRGRGRAAQPGRDDRRRAAGQGRARWPT